MQAQARAQAHGMAPKRGSAEGTVRKVVQGKYLFIAGDDGSDYFAPFAALRAAAAEVSPGARVTFSALPRKQGERSPRAVDISLAAMGAGLPREGMPQARHGGAQGKAFHQKKAASMAGLLVDMARAAAHGPHAPHVAHAASRDGRAAPDGGMPGMSGGGRQGGLPEPDAEEAARELHHVAKMLYRYKEWGTGTIVGVEARETASQSSCMIEGADGEAYAAPILEFVDYGAERGRIRPGARVAFIPEGAPGGAGMRAATVVRLIGEDGAFAP